MSDPQPRTTSWITLLYYYVAALIGLVIAIVGLVIALNALVDAIFFEPPPATPDDFAFYGDDDRGDKLRMALQGAVTAVVGAPIFWWHLSQARRLER